MRIIHGAGFSEAKRRKYAALVVRQIYQIMQTLIHAMELLNIPYASAQSEVRIVCLSINQFHKAAVKQLFIRKSPELSWT